MLNIIITDRETAGDILMSDQGSDITHIVSIYDTPGVFRTPVPCLGFNAHSAKKIHLQFDDCICSNAHYTAVSENQVQQIIDFANEIPLNAKLLVHCAAGISRSTAATYVILCILYGDGKEKQAFEKVLETQPNACPNHLVVEIAEKLLKRSPKMIIELDNFIHDLIT